MTIFDTKDVNTGRQKEVDFAKAVAVILMVVCHVGIYLAPEGTLLCTIFDYLGGEFAAPVFMFCMGLGMCYSRHNEPKLIASRGLKIFLMGYGLNLVRGVLPMLFAKLLGKSFVEGRSYLEWFMMVDILQFAGLAMIVIALFDKFKLHPAIQVMIAIVVAGFGESLAYKSTGIEFLDLILDNLWGADEYAFFPLCAWLIYPVLGRQFGQILRKVNDTKRLYMALLPVSAAAVALVMWQSIWNYEGYYVGANYYFMGVKCALLASFFPLFQFSMGSLIVPKLSEKVWNVCDRLSRYVNEIYIISWVIILWVRVFVWDAGALPVCVLSVVITIVSYILAVKYKSFKKKRAK